MGYSRNSRNSPAMAILSPCGDHVPCSDSARRVSMKYEHLFGVCLSAILAAPIRVVNQTCCRSFGSHCPHQRMDDQVLRYALCHSITYDFSGKKILMASKIQAYIISLGDE